MLAWPTSAIARPWPPDDDVETHDPPSPTRGWAAEPELSDDAVRQATGHGWDDWCDRIRAWPGQVDGHAAVAAHLVEHEGLDGWWAQSVTVGYERITGLRVPHQRPDGSFSAHKSRTVTVDGEALRSMLSDDTERAHLFPGLDTVLRSRPTAKAIRVAIGPGVATIAIEAVDDSRTRVVVRHERLPTAAEVDRWKGYWSGWLAAVDQS